ncbi:hypothetical protein HBI16_012320 [Parastagonospora nodorum]|nr:hypothetical protein HBI16_012320 [Parastagonospora nodorum]
MNLGMWMFNRGRVSPYLHNNVPLMQEGNAEDSSSVNSTVRIDSVDMRSETNPRGTMMDQIGRKVGPGDEDFEDGNFGPNSDEEQRAELQLYGTEEQMATLQDLRELLYTRGRLQELGCTFSEPGELITYGGPQSLKESEQLLRLGPIYDEQWASFFRRPDFPFPDDDPSMWSDMRTLKRVLGNEGVKFDPQHRRLSWSVGGDKIIFLCAAYDDLQKLWTASLPSICILPPVDEREEEELNESVDDSGIFMDEEPHHELPDQTNERYALDRLSDVPRNIGWRFSDDIDRTTAASHVDSMTARNLAELNEDVDAAVALSFPLTKSEPSRCATPDQVDESKSPAASTKFGKFLNAARPRHGPPRLQVSGDYTHSNAVDTLTNAQNVTTHSVTQREELIANPRANGMDNLALDDKMIELINPAPNMDGVPQAHNAKKKGLKGWWKGVVGRRMNAVPDKQV